MTNNYQAKKKNSICQYVLRFHQKISKLSKGGNANKQEFQRKKVHFRHHETLFVYILKVFFFRDSAKIIQTSYFFRVGMR